MSQVASPTYQQRAGSTATSFAASSRRSGSGLACSTWLASTIVGSPSSPRAATDVLTWSLRLEVAIAQASPRASMARTTSRTPGSGAGDRFSRSYVSPDRLSMVSARSSSSETPASAAISRASRLPSTPISGARRSCVVGKPASSSARSQASMRVSTVSTSVPSRSNSTAFGSGNAWRSSGMRLR